MRHATSSVDASLLSTLHGSRERCKHVWCCLVHLLAGRPVSVILVTVSEGISFATFRPNGDLASPHMKASAQERVA
jgi:hypothetical protein